MENFCINLSNLWILFMNMYLKLHLPKAFFSSKCTNRPTVWRPAEELTGAWEDRGGTERRGEEREERKRDGERMSSFYGSQIRSCLRALSDCWRLQFSRNCRHCAPYKCFHYYYYYYYYYIPFLHRSHSLDSAVAKQLEPSDLTN